METLYVPCRLDRFSDEKAIYPKYGDNRRNLYEVGIKDIKTQAASVACLMENDHIKLSSPGLYKLEGETLGQRVKDRHYAHLANIRFTEEPSLGFGTAFLVGPRLALTAAHCVCKDKSNELDMPLIEKTRLVFGFQMKSANDWEKIIEEKYIYEFIVIQRKYEFRKCDWALLELKKEVTIAAPLQVDFTNIVVNQLSIYMLGHPYGVPIKVVEEGEVKENRPADERAQAEIVAFEGNSGSPIFSKETHKVIGILVGGNKDFIKKQGIVKDYQLTDDDIQKSGYEKMQRTSSLPDTVIERISKVLVAERQEIDESFNKVIRTLTEEKIKDITTIESELKIIGGNGFLPAYSLLSKLINEFGPGSTKSAENYLKMAKGYPWYVQPIQTNKSCSAFSLAEGDSAIYTITDGAGYSNTSYSESKGRSTLIADSKGGGHSDSSHVRTFDNSISTNLSREKGYSDSHGSTTKDNASSFTGTNLTKKEKKKLEKEQAKREEARQRAIRKADKHSTDER